MINLKCELLPATLQLPSRANKDVLGCGGRSTSFKLKHTGKEAEKYHTGRKKEDMHELARKHLERILSERRCTGPHEECPYYPCHQEHQDCTWCFCPFYPCEDEDTGGKWKMTSQGTRIWDCSDCIWIHRSDVAAELMKLLNRFGILSVEDIGREERIRDEMRAAAMSDERVASLETAHSEAHEHGRAESRLLIIFEYLKRKIPPEQQLQETCAQESRSER